MENNLTPKNYMDILEELVLEKEITRQEYYELKETYERKLQKSPQFVFD